MSEQKEPKYLLSLNTKLSTQDYFQQINKNPEAHQEVILINENITTSLIDQDKDLLISNNHPINKENLELKNVNEFKNNKYYYYNNFAYSLNPNQYSAEILHINKKINPIIISDSNTEYYSYNKNIHYQIKFNSEIYNKTRLIQSQLANKYLTIGLNIDVDFNNETDLNDCLNEIRKMYILDSVDISNIVLPNYLLLNAKKYDDLNLKLVVLLVKEFKMPVFVKTTFIDFCEADSTNSNENNNNKKFIPLFNGFNSKLKKAYDSINNKVNNEDNISFDEIASKIIININSNFIISEDFLENYRKYIKDNSNINSSISFNQFSQFQSISIPNGHNTSSNKLGFILNNKNYFYDVDFDVKSYITNSLLNNNYIFLFALEERDFAFISFANSILNKLLENRNGYFNNKQLYEIKAFCSKINQCANSHFDNIDLKKIQYLSQLIAKYNSQILIHPNFSFLSNYKDFGGVGYDFFFKEFIERLNIEYEVICRENNKVYDENDVCRTIYTNFISMMFWWKFPKKETIRIKYIDCIFCKKATPDNDDVIRKGESVFCSFNCISGFNKAKIN